MKKAGVRQVVLDKWFPLKSVLAPILCQFHASVTGEVGKIDP